MDEITVLRHHLEELERALDHAYTYFAARDLAKAAEQMSTAPSSSRITKTLEAQIQRLRGYLDEPVPGA
jgi:hypothetical protein